MGGVGEPEDELSQDTVDIASALADAQLCRFKLQLVTDWGTMFTSEVPVNVPGKLFEVRVFVAKGDAGDFMFYGALSPALQRQTRVQPIRLPQVPEGGSDED